MAKDTEDLSEPTAFTGAELVLVGPAVALAKHAYDAWKEGRPAVPPSDPLTFGVVDSLTGRSGHKLILMCSNLGAHGVYLENVIVSDPAGINAAAEVRTKEHARIGLGDTDQSVSPPQLLPILVPSGGTAILIVLISPPLSPDRMKKKPFGKLSVSYTVLGVADTGLKKTVEFSVRPSS